MSCCWGPCWILVGSAFGSLLRTWVQVSYSSLGKGSSTGNYRVPFKGFEVIEGRFRVVVLILQAIGASGRGAKATL